MYQQLVLIGHCGNTPDLRTTPENVPYCHSRVAIHRRWTLATGEKREKILWFRVTAWRRQAELAAQQLTKGQSVIVIGEVSETRAYRNQAGEPAAAIEVTAHTIRLWSDQTLFSELEPPF